MAAGLIHSNVLDMANYIQFYLNKGTFKDKRVLSEESISDMKANHMKDVVLSNTENWGYGLYTKTVWIKTGKDSMTANIIGHGGDTYAFHSDFGFIPELNVGFVILTNTDNGGMIRSINKLLKTYLKETKGKTVNFIYNDKSDSLASEKEFPCKPEEIIGSYNMGDMLMQAKNDKKIKFKQGLTKIVLKQKKSQPNMYSIKAILFGVIPIKVKDQEFTFVKMNSEVFLKVLYTKTKKQEFIAVKSSSMPISNAWKEQFGNYKIINANYKCTDCPYGITEGMTLKLLEAKGFIQLKTSGKTPDTKGSVYANIISDNMAVSGGIGRGTGETIKILENGNIYYSGFEFKKVE